MALNLREILKLTKRKVNIPPCFQFPILNVLKYKLPVKKVLQQIQRPLITTRQQEARANLFWISCRFRKELYRLSIIEVEFKTKLSH